MQEATASLNIFINNGPKSIGSYTRRNSDDRDLTNDEVQQAIATAAYAQKFYLEMMTDGSSHEAAAAAVTASIPGTGIVEQIDEGTKPVDTRPAPPSPQAPPQAPPQQNVEVVRGKYAYWVYNHPQAPLTPAGQKAVMKHARSMPPKSNLYQRWVDPAVAQSDGKEKNPAWPGDFCGNDVDKSMLAQINDI